MKKAKDSLKKIGGKSKGFRKEFIEFINRGSVMDLAVGIIIGSAFTAIVNSLVNDIVMPLVSLVGGGFDFTSLSVQVGDATITYGNFVQNVVNFLIVALVVFIMIKILNGIRARAERLKKKEEAAAAEEEKKEEDETVKLLREIRNVMIKK